LASRGKSNAPLGVTMPFEEASRFNESPASEPNPGGPSISPQIAGQSDSDRTDDQQPKGELGAGVRSGAEIEEEMEDIDLLTRQYLDDLLSKYSGISEPKPAEEAPPEPAEPPRTYNGPTPAPERSVDFRGIREAFNANAREKIQDADRRKFRQALLLLVVATLLTVACIVTAITADTMQSATYFGSIVALLLACIFSFQFFRISKAIQRELEPLP
jgi:hypothetical protein